MPIIRNKVKKKSFSALTGAVSGFNMGNEFNSLSQTSILCGTKFQEYPPFQDAPDDLIDGLADTMKNIGGNVLGGLASFVSVLGNNNMFYWVLCAMSGGIIQAVAGKYDIAGLMKVVVGGLAFQTQTKEMITPMKEGIIQMKRFIPQKIPNEVLLGVFEEEAKIEAWMKHNFWIKLPSRMFMAGFIIPIPEITALSVESHKTHNLDILCSGIPQKTGDNKMIYTAGEYIENQNEWEDVKFGISDMKFSGCEIMATYNALLALGEHVSEQTVVDLIAKYENDGAVFGGLLGSSSYTIEDYFREQGYDVVTTTSQDSSTINKIGERSDTIIVYAYNDKNDITAQIHTVSITKEEDGTYSVHNASNKTKDDEYSINNGYEKKGGYDTLQDAINDISSDPASIDVIGISNAKIGDFVSPEEHAGGVPS